MRRASSTWKTSPARMYSLMRCDVALERLARVSRRAAPRPARLMRRASGRQHVRAVQARDGVVERGAGTCVQLPQASSSSAPAGTGTDTITRACPRQLSMTTSASVNTKQASGAVQRARRRIAAAARYAAPRRTRRSPPRRSRTGPVPARPPDAWRARCRAGPRWDRRGAGAVPPRAPPSNPPRRRRAAARRRAARCQGTCSAPRSRRRPAPIPAGTRTVRDAASRNAATGVH